MLSKYEWSGLKNLIAIKAVKADPLPSTYQRYDWLLLTGHNAKIDTGVSGANSALKIVFDCMMLSNGTYGSYYGIFGNATSGKKYWVMRRPAQSDDSSVTKWMVCLGNTGSQTVVAPYGAETLLDKKTNYVFEYGKVIANGVVVTSAESSEAAYDGNIMIGTTSSTSSGIALSQSRIWGFKMWNGEELVRDYIPCVRKSDSKAGFYDLVNGTFNPSIGSAEFVAGMDA